MEAPDEERLDFTAPALAPLELESAGSFEIGSNELDTQTNKEGAGQFFTTRSKGVASDVKFIQCTYMMLEDCTRDCPHIISWTKEGDAIEVKDIAALESAILRNYYNSSKYETFVRQLNKYDFKRHKPEAVGRTRAPNVRDVFHHDFFKRDQRELLTMVQKKRNSQGRVTMKFDCKEEVQALQEKVASVEERHLEILQSVKKIQDTLDERLHKRPLTPTRSQDAAAEVLERMEKRMKYVEDCLSTLLSSHRHPRQHSWPSGPSSLFPAEDSSSHSVLPEVPPPHRSSFSMPSAETLDPHPGLNDDFLHFLQTEDSGLVRETTDDSAVSWIKGIHYMEED